MNDTLKLVLTHHWFDEIKSGRKKYEYREAKQFWVKRFLFCDNFKFVEFQRAYAKGAEKMTFRVKSIKFINGLDTDLHIDRNVYAIELGERIYKMKNTNPPMKNTKPSTNRKEKKNETVQNK